MDTVAIVFLAMATCLAAGTALWIAMAFIERERRLQQKKASVLRGSVDRPAPYSRRIRRPSRTAPGSDAEGKL